MNEKLQTLHEAVAFIKSKSNLSPTCGIILGTGLGALTEEIEIEVSLPYGEIPHFPLSTVETHEGQLIFGTLSGKKVVVMQGRFHYYEGYTFEQVAFPVQVMKLLGIDQLCISNISGSVNADIGEGDLVLIDDHINLQPGNPLVGPNIDELGPRWPDMYEPYSFDLIKLAEKCAQELKFSLKRGVYASVAGPNLETRAEYRFLNRIGADIVGMSTVPEVIAAVHAGIKVLAISVVTDKNWPYENIGPVDIPHIIDVAMKTEPKLTQLMKEIINKI